MAGMGVAGVAVSQVGGVSMARVAAVTSVARAPYVGETADCHRGEACAAQREAEPIDVHTSNTTHRTAGW
jgi:hypothetical protein